MSETKKQDRDFEKQYNPSQMADKLRRMADSIEQGKPYEIMVGGERIYVPVGAEHNIEHEREDGFEELEFQFKWKSNN